MEIIAQVFYYSGVKGNASTEASTGSFPHQPTGGRDRTLAVKSST